MEILERYRKERPDIFARLPIPKELAEKMGCPIKDDIINLNEYLREHLSSRGEHYEQFEEKVGVEIVKDPNYKEPEKPKVDAEKFMNILKDQTFALHPLTMPPDLANSTEANETKNLLLSPQISSNPHSSPSDVPSMTLSV